MAFVLPTFNAHLKNCSDYCKEDDDEFLNHISNFAQIKGMLYILSKIKTL